VLASCIQRATPETVYEGKVGHGNFREIEVKHNLRCKCAYMHRVAARWEEPSLLAILNKWVAEGRRDLADGTYFGVVSPEIAEVQPTVLRLVE
jgi:hypothetical protein